MMNQNYNDFNDLVKCFTRLNLKEKRKIIKEDLEELVTFLSKLNSNHSLNSEKIFNNKMLNIEKADCTEEEYIEAVYVYLHSIKDLLATYISSLEFKEDNNE